MTCPKAQVRSAAARSAVVRRSPELVPLGQDAGVEQVGHVEDLRLVVVLEVQRPGPVRDLQRAPRVLERPPRSRSPATVGRLDPHRAARPPRPAAARRPRSSRRRAGGAAEHAPRRTDRRRRWRAGRRRRTGRRAAGAGVSTGHSSSTAARIWASPARSWRMSARSAAPEQQLVAGSVVAAERVVRVRVGPDLGRDLIGQRVEQLRPRTPRGPRCAAGRCGGPGPGRARTWHGSSCSVSPFDVHGASVRPAPPDGRRSAAASTSTMDSRPLISAVAGVLGAGRLNSRVTARPGWTAARRSRPATAAPGRCSAGRSRSDRRSARPGWRAARGTCRAGRPPGAARPPSCRCPVRPGRPAPRPASDRMISVLLGLDGLDDVAHPAGPARRSARPAGRPRRSARTARTGRARRWPGRAPRRRGR